MTHICAYWMRFAAFWLAIAVPPFAEAVTVVSGPSIKATATSAIITWRTDVETGTRVKYGTAPNQLTSQAEGTVTQEHQVSLSALTPSTTYHFEFGTARRALGSGTFKTSAQGDSVTQSPTRAEPPKAPSKLLPKIAVPVQTAAPPAKVTWANLDSLADHFHRHGADFRAISADDYAAQAWGFLQRAKQTGLPMKWDAEDQTLRVWEPASRSFAAYDRRGRSRTYFKPSNPAYWERQPGRPIKAQDLPF